MRRAIAAVVAALVLTGCSGSETGADTGAEPDDEATASSSPSATTSPSAAESPTAPATTEDDHADAIPVEIKGDEVEPRGKRVKVGIGEEITLHVESNRPAELHVHSSPEQTLKVAEGTSMLTLTVDTPGVVDVEEHDTGIVVLQLEVR